MFKARVTIKGENFHMLVDYYKAACLMAEALEGQRTTPVVTINGPFEDNYGDIFDFVNEEITQFDYTRLYRKGTWYQPTPKATITIRYMTEGDR